MGMKEWMSCRMMWNLSHLAVVVVVGVAVVAVGC